MLQLRTDPFCLFLSDFSYLISHQIHNLKLAIPSLLLILLRLQYILVKELPWNILFFPLSCWEVSSSNLLSPGHLSARLIQFYQKGNFYILKYWISECHFIKHWKWIMWISRFIFHYEVKLSQYARWALNYLVQIAVDESRWDSSLFTLLNMIVYTQYEINNLHPSPLYPAPKQHKSSMGTKTNI